MTHDVFALTQVAFRGRNDNGNETTASWKANINTNWNQPVDTKFRVRFGIQESGAGTASGTLTGQLQYQLAGGGWNNVTTSSSVCRAVASGDAGGPYDGTATTEQLNQSQPFKAGSISEDGLAGAVSLAGDDETELEYVLTIQSADVTNGQALELRVNDGTTTPTWTQIPSITIQEVTNYTLTADGGTFAMTGTAANTLYGRNLAAASGSFAYTGTAAGFLRGLRVIADSGSFGLTGTDVSLLRDAILAALGGTFDVTGTAATLAKGRTLITESGSFSVAGTAASLLATKLLSALGGSFSVSGADAALSKGFTLSALGGSFSLSGTAASPLHSRRLAADSGSFSFVGTSLGFLLGRRLVADSGSFSFNGFVAGLLHAKILQAAGGSFAYTGSDVTFTVASSSTYTLDCESGVFNVRPSMNYRLRTDELIDAALGANLMGTLVQTSRTATAVPLAVAVDRNGGQAGLTVTAAVRDASTTNSYLDFNDSTFKTTGWTAKTLTLTDLGGGFYAATLNVAAITNLPANADLVVEYSASGSVGAVGLDFISFQNNDVWKDPKALTVPKFLGLK